MPGFPLPGLTDAPKLVPLVPVVEWWPDRVAGGRTDEVFEGIPSVQRKSGHATGLSADAQGGQPGARAREFASLAASDLPSLALDSLELETFVLSGACAPGGLIRPESVDSELDQSRCAASTLGKPGTSRDRRVS